MGCVKVLVPMRMVGVGEDRALNRPPSGDVGETADRRSMRPSRIECERLENEEVREAFARHVSGLFQQLPPVYADTDEDWGCLRRL